MPLIHSGPADSYAGGFFFLFSKQKFVISTCISVQICNILSVDSYLSNLISICANILLIGMIDTGV